MNIQKIISQLKRKYPKKHIILNPPENPTEIVVEIDPTQDHPDHGTALAVVGKSAPHYHKKTTETYEVIKGILTVYIDGKKYTLSKGEKITIKPGQKHHVKGTETWFLTYAKPGWTAEDHFII